MTITPRHLYDYDDRYFDHTTHTREELYALQSVIMDTTSCNDFAKAIDELKMYEEKKRLMFVCVDFSLKN